MKPEEIHLYDIARIIMGDVPGSFLLEVVVRITFLFVLLLASMRLMGRRMASTLSRNELVAMVSLAAATGVPLQDPARGLLPAVIISAIVIGVQRGIAYGTFKSKRIERITQGNLDTLVADGCIRLEALERTGLSKERIFAELRREGIINLGSVQRMYLESSGQFSILVQPKPLPGLPILPDWDQDFIQEHPVLNDTYACAHCGNTVKNSHPPDQACERCGHQEWQNAVES